MGHRRETVVQTVLRTARMVPHPEALLSEYLMSGLANQGARV